MSKKEFSSQSRRIQADRRTITNPRPPKPSSSPSPSSSSSRRRYRPRKSSQRITRSRSAPPSLPTLVAASQSEKIEVEQVPFRQSTCNNIFSSPDYRAPLRGTKQSYNKEGKVLLNVTVEGSSGPIRALVKSGATVDETITAVLQQYTEEGRTPRQEKDTASKWELHHSKFTLESLSRSDLIGDLGSRSFYLHRCIDDSDRHTTEDSSLVPFPSFMQNFIQKSKCFRRLLGCFMIKYGLEQT